VLEGLLSVLPSAPLAGVSLSQFSAPASVSVDEALLVEVASSADEEDSEGANPVELFVELLLAAFVAFSRASTESRVAALALAAFELEDVDASPAAIPLVPASEEEEVEGPGAAFVLPSSSAVVPAAARALAKATCFAMRCCTFRDAAGPKLLHPSSAVITAKSASSAFAEYSSLAESVAPSPVLTSKPLLLLLLSFERGLLSRTGKD
jgi:hypothetical protein